MKKNLFAFILLVSCILLFTKCDETLDPTTENVEFKISPDTLIITDEDTLSQLFISTQPKGEVEYEVTQKPSWLSIDHWKGTTDGSIKSIKIRPLKNNLNEGVYKGKISIITNTAGKADAVVMMSVNGHPKIKTNISEINFSENVSTTQLIIENSGTGLLTWSINDIPQWLSLSSTSGYLVKGEKQTVNIICNRTNLDNKTYTANLTINSNSETTLAPLSVSMVVPRMTSLKISNKNILFDYFSDSEEVYLRNTGNTDFSWNTAKESYYTITPNSGTIAKGDSVLIRIALDRTGLTSGTTESNIVIQTDPNLKDTIKTQINHFKNTKWQLDRNIVDAEFSKETNKIIIVSTNPNRLSIIDPDSKSIESIDINADPKCLSVNKNGDHAVIGHNGMVTFINLTTKSIEKECAISCDALDIILTTANWAYIFPVRDQWTNIRCLNLTTKAETLQTGYSIYAGTVGRLHPSEKWIYGADNGLSPSDIEKYNIENGTAVNLYDSPYHGDYPMSGNLWFSEDGDRIFTKGKTVLKTSSDKASDMIYNGALSCTDNIKTLIHSKVNDKIFLVTQAGYYWSDVVASSEVQVFNYTYMNYLYKYSLESFMIPFGQKGGKLYNSEGQYVFTNKAGTKLYAIVKAANGSGLLNDWGIQNFDIQ